MLALRHKELITRNTGSEEDILLALLYSIVLVIQSCLTLCEPMCCSLSGFSVHGILQASILE